MRVGEVRVGDVLSERCNDTNYPNIAIKYDHKSLQPRETICPNTLLFQEKKRRVTDTTENLIFNGNATYTSRKAPNVFMDLEILYDPGSPRKPYTMKQLNNHKKTLYVFGNICSVRTPANDEGKMASVPKSDSIIPINI